MTSALEEAAALVQEYGGVAVFSHDVETVLSPRGGEPATLRERETIVFRPDGERWMAVHEHLSPAAGPCLA